LQSCFREGKMQRIEHLKKKESEYKESLSLIQKNISYFKNIPNKEFDEKDKQELEGLSSKQKKLSGDINNVWDELTYLKNNPGFCIYADYLENEIKQLKEHVQILSLDVLNLEDKVKEIAKLGGVIQELLTRVSALEQKDVS